MAALDKLDWTIDSDKQAKWDKGEYVEDLTEKLNNTWQEISTKLYEQTTQEDAPNENSSEDVTDVEYEEVKE